MCGAVNVIFFSRENFAQILARLFMLGIIFMILPYLLNRVTWVVWLSGEIFEKAITRST